jgi:chaperonin GroES
MNILETNIVVIGDRVLIKPVNPEATTPGGLYLPPGLKEKEEVHTGRVLKVGPGYPIPVQQDYDEYLKENKEKVQYIPLQVQVGDLALFLQKQSWEVEYNSEKYFIVNQSSILMVLRDQIPGLDF